MNQIAETKQIEQKPLTIAGMLVNKSFKDQIKLSLPNNISVDRFCRIALTEVRKNKKLLDCTIESFSVCIFTASQLGLEIGSSLGHAYLVPYGKECQLIVGYRGLAELAYRTGKIKNIHADAVYENDFFDFEYGSNQFLRHKPNIEEKDRKILFFYSCASIVGGGFQFIVMPKSQVDKVRKSSSKYSPMWENHYAEMGKKTAFRRLSKLLPSSPELQYALSKEDDNEKNVPTLFISDSNGDNFTDFEKFETQKKSDEIEKMLPTVN